MERFAGLRPPREWETRSRLISLKLKGFAFRDVTSPKCPKPSVVLWSKHVSATGVGSNATRPPQFCMTAELVVSIPAAPAKRRRRRQSDSATGIARNPAGSCPQFPTSAAPISMTAAPVSMTTRPAKRRRRRRSNLARQWSRVLGLLFPLVPIAGMAVVVVQSEYSISLRPPLRLGWQWPMVFSPRIVEEETRPTTISPRIVEEEKKAQADQFGHKLTHPCQHGHRTARRKLR